MNFWSYLLIGGVVLVLAVVLWARPSAAAVDGEWKKTSKESLFVDLTPEKNSWLLDDWRWKVGDQAAVFRVTVFGDIFTQTPDGRIHLLEVHTGRYAEVAKSAEKWAKIFESRGSEWVHWKLLQELRALKMELPAGHVFDFQQSPLLGGKEEVGNIQWLPVAAQASAAGQLAQSIEDEKAGRRQPPEAEDDTTLYTVVINSELQYSIWPVGRDLPEDWKSAGKVGTKQECLEHIAEVWTDMRPLSLRKKLEEGEQQP